MENFGDPKFEYHKAMTQLMALVAYSISTEAILPFNQTGTGEDLLTSFFMIKEKLHDTFSGNSRFSEFNFNKFEKSINLFVTASHFANDEIKRFQKEDFQQVLDLPDDVVDLNQMLFKTERCFLNPEGLPRRPFFKHVLSSPSYLDTYSDSRFFFNLAFFPTNIYLFFFSRFPGITDAIVDQDIDRAIEQLSKTVWFTELTQSLSF